MLRLRYILLIVALMTSGYACSDNPSPSAANPSANAKTETTKNKKNVSAAKLDTKPLTTSIEITKTPVLNIEIAENHKEASREWWLIFITGVLAVVTGFLWRSTSSLVRDAKASSQRQLRAYVSLTEILNVTIDSVSKVDSLVIRIKNFGATPAHDVFVAADMYRNRGEEAATWDGLVADQSYVDGGKRLLHPQQKWDSFQGQQDFYVEVDEPYYVIGRIVYRDIFNNYWECAFHFLHRSSDRWEPMDETHNYEKKIDRPLD